MNDETLKVVLDQIQGSLEDLKGQLRELTVEFARLDKHNAEDHANLTARLKTVEKNMAGSASGKTKLIGAIVTMSAGFAALASYAIHLFTASGH
jgi:hypothetical protein